MKIAQHWNEYRLLDCGEGEKLEYWGDWLLARPDPQAIWPKSSPELWAQAHGWYHRNAEGGGQWEWHAKLPSEWQVRYRDLVFLVRPTDFKHTGLFPEQAVNWDWLQSAIRQAGRPVSVLNLFAYTGAATVAGIAAGAEVCHVDAAKGMVRWAERNLEINGLRQKPMRLIVDDVTAFVRREVRRGRRYDAILMDPPSYGRGSQGETWKLARDLPELLTVCRDVLSEKPVFVQINGYTSGYPATVYANLLQTIIGSKFPGQSECGEIGLLSETKPPLVLPCGIYARWLPPVDEKKRPR